MVEQVKQMVQIVTDSSCDLPRQVLERFKISVVPLVVRFGTDVFEEGKLSLEAFWERAARQHPETSQPSVGTFEEVFEGLISRGKQVLCLTVTSKHSGTLNAAYAAAQRFGERVKVFDSLSLSLGQGIMTMAAAQAAQAGRSMQDILAVLEDLRERMRVLIVLDTLENLRRGGRADAFIAAADRMARALNIKPVINVVEGQVRLMSAARSFDGGLRRIVKQIEQLGPLEYLAVAHTRRLDKAEEMASQLAERLGFPREEIWVRETGAVLSTHGGPRLVGVMAVPAR